MKILFFSSKVDAEHKIARTLERNGIGVLFPESPDEVLQLLRFHGLSLDLAIFHFSSDLSTDLKDASHPIVKLLEEMKTDPLQSDLPFIFIVEKISEQDCAVHQQGPLGANAYIKWPFSPDSFLRLIEEVVPYESLQVEEMPEIVFKDFPPPIPVDSLEESRILSFEKGEIKNSQTSESFQNEREFLEFQKKQGGAFFYESVGDAVVPGGAANHPDIETFKKYLFLREQDVAVLSQQLKLAQEQKNQIEAFLREEKKKSEELSVLVSEQSFKILEFEKKEELRIESEENIAADLRKQVREKSDRERALDKDLKKAQEEMERLKERVRLDIRKIRVHEKELENRLEILKKDSEVLIAARENKIVELKRKLDLLEFNMDLLQDQYTKEKGLTLKIKEKLLKASQAVGVAAGCLEFSKNEIFRDFDSQLDVDFEIPSSPPEIQRTSMDSQISPTIHSPHEIKRE